MLDSEEKEYNKILNSLDPKEATPSEQFKNQLQEKLVREVNKGQGLSLSDWYLNVLSLVLVVISISLVAYFGVLSNTKTGTTTGSNVVLSELDKERILENYTKNNPETLTRRKAVPVVSFAEQKSSNYFRTEKNQTFGNEYFRCTDSYLIVNQTIVEETFYGTNKALIKEVTESGLGNLISEKLITYTAKSKITEEYRGGEYIAVTTEANRVNIQAPNTTITPVIRDGVEAFEIEYRSFLECKGVQEQLITNQYVNSTTYKVESEEVYLGEKSEDKLYSITSIETTERDISRAEEKSIFSINQEVPTKEINNLESQDILVYLVPISDTEGFSYIPTNVVSGLTNINYIDISFYEDSRWGEELFEHNVSLLNNPSVTYDIQLSPFEFTKVTISPQTSEETVTGAKSAVIVVDGSRVDAKISTSPVSFTENSDVLMFEYEGYTYKIETTDLSIFEELVTFGI